MDNLNRYDIKPGYINFDSVRIYLGFSLKKFGFGEVRFEQNNEHIGCYNECMGKGLIKRMLCALVDTAEFLEQPLGDSDELVLVNKKELEEMEARLAVLEEKERYGE